MQNGWNSATRRHPFDGTTAITMAGRRVIGYLWNFGGGFLDLPVLAHGDADRYHSIFYLGLLAPADETAQSPNLRGLKGLSDDQALARIQADDLDALIILDSLGYFSCR